MATSKRTGGYVKVNEYGRRINDTRGRLTDHEVTLVLALLAEGLSQRAVARKMEISRTAVQKIFRRYSRAQVPIRRGALAELHR